MSARRFLPVVAFALAAFSSGAAAQEAGGALPRPSADAEVAFLSFRHAGLIDTVVTAVFDADSLYVPLAEVFRVLGVPVVLDLRGGRAFGSAPGGDWDYVLDLGSGVARAGPVEAALAPGDALVGDLDVFVLPSALDRVFGIRVLVDPGELVLRIDPLDRSFPVVEADRRRRLRSRLVSDDRFAAHAPLRAARRRRQLYGGVLDYALDNSTGAGPDATSYALGTGFEALGGDLQAGLRGSASGAGMRVSDLRGSWRYVFDEGARWISQVRLGNVTPGALRSFDLHGFRLTNEPVQPRRLFAVHTLRGRTQPDAEVELYVNGRLQDFTTADALGAYEFRVPLVYGRTVVSLRFYGQSGEFLREERGVPIPFGLVPDGAVDYSVAAGARDGRDGGAFLSRVSWGVTDRLTATTGLEYVAGPASSELVAYESVVARLSQGLHAAVDLAPGAFARASLEGFSSSLASASAEITRFADSPTYDPLGQDWRLRLTGFSPFRLGSVGMTGRVIADWSRTDTGDADAALELEAVASVGRLRQSVAFRARSADNFFGPSQSRQLSVGTLYAVSGHDGAFGALDGSLVRAIYTRALGRSGADRAEVTLTRPLTRDTRVSITAERNFALDAARLEVRLTYDGDPLLATLGLSRDEGGIRVRQTVRGAVALDPAGDRLVPTKQPWIGRSGAAFRFFVDRDGDRLYSPGERLVDGGEVRFRESVAVHRGEDSVLRAVDLLAYQQYSVRIDDATVRDPSLVPFVREFSFVTDPNSYKTLDVPFYVGGEVDGTVTLTDRTGTRPLAGARLTIRCLEGCEFTGTTTTFADGTYYLSALPPGRYEVALDGGQLREIGARAEPAAREFRLEFDELGDSETGLDFRIAR